MLRSTHAVISLTALKHNVLTAKSKLKPDTRLMCIIKANAYGHGIVRVGQYLDAMDEVDAFGVAIPEEGVQLRQNGVKKPILILGATDPQHVSEIVRHSLSPAVFLPELLPLLEAESKRQGKRTSIHIKLDTGMRRIGIPTEKELVDFLDILRTCDHLTVSGVFTHFAKSESDPAFTALQADRFARMVHIIRKCGYQPTVHAANSAAILLHPAYQYDMVRLGIALYGSHPDPALTPGSSLRPVMRWVSGVTNLKTIEAGEGVSYGLRFVAKRESRIATLPVGYGDGYKRAMTNNAMVLIGGMRCPQVGTICMDQIMVDVTDVPNVQIGDEAVLLGEQGSERITADELAAWAGTISYEILLSVSERVPRIYE